MRAEIAIAVTLALFGLLWLWNPSGLYLWLKAFHVIAVIAWMAGMLYLPRLFVYHCEAEAGSRQSETFKVMERRLLRAIINPAMVATWVLGLWLAWDGGFLKAGWLHGKLVLVLILSGIHGLLTRCGARLRGRPQCPLAEVLPGRQRDSGRADGRNRHSGDRQAVLIAG